MTLSMRREKSTKGEKANSSSLFSQKVWIGNDKVQYKSKLSGNLTNSRIQLTVSEDGSDDFFHCDCCQGYLRILNSQHRKATLRHIRSRLIHKPFYLKKWKTDLHFISENEMMCSHWRDIWPWPCKTIFTNLPIAPWFRYQASLFHGSSTFSWIYGYCRRRCSSEGKFIFHCWAVK